MRKIYDILNAGLLALITYTVLSRYSSLPDRIPVHFGISGAPDRWGSKSELFILVALVWGLTVLLYVFILSVPGLGRKPRLLNIPNKEELLKLTPERQAPFWELLQEFMAGLAVSINLLFYLMIRGTLLLIRGDIQLLPFRNVVAGLAVVFLVIIVYLPRMFALPKKLIRGEGP
jgi:uncharacterized membrane protein